MRPNLTRVTTSSRMRACTKDDTSVLQSCRRDHLLLHVERSSNSPQASPDPTGTESLAVRSANLLKEVRATVVVSALDYATHATARHLPVPLELLPSSGSPCHVPCSVTGFNFRQRQPLSLTAGVKCELRLGGLTLHPNPTPRATTTPPSNSASSLAKSR